jgi:hypothetical protein
VSLQNIEKFFLARAPALIVHKYEINILNEIIGGFWTSMV